MYEEFNDLIRAIVDTRIAVQNVANHVSRTCTRSSGSHTATTPGSSSSSRPWSECTRASKVRGTTRIGCVRPHRSARPPMTGEQQEQSPPWERCGRRPKLNYAHIEGAS